MMPAPEPDHRATLRDAAFSGAIRLEADPAPVLINLHDTALLVIDPQRDFMERGGYGEMLGNNPEILRSIITPLTSVLTRARELGMAVIFFREGHRADLSDCPPSKLVRWPEGRRIGDPGPMGRILIRGEPGHAIIPELAPLPSELVIDKPGKDGFYGTLLDQELRRRKITNLLVGGVTTEVCVGTTVRTGNDRGYQSIVIEDCCASYDPARHQAEIATITAQGGIFGFKTDSARLLYALAR